MSEPTVGSTARSTILLEGAESAVEIGGTGMASFGAIVPLRWITTIGVKTDPVAWSVAFARQAAKTSHTELDGEPQVGMLDLPSSYGGRCVSVQWNGD